MKESLTGLEDLTMIHTPLSLIVQKDYITML